MTSEELFEKNVYKTDYVLYRMPSTYANLENSDNYLKTVIEDFCEKFDGKEHSSYLYAYCRTNKVSLPVLLKKFGKYRHGISKNTREFLEKTLMEWSQKSK